MNRPLSGQYYDGQTAKSYSIQLDLDEQCVVHDLHSLLVTSTPLKDLSLSSRVGNIARKLTFPSGAVFETEDHETLDQWLQHAGIGQGFAHKFESSMPYVASAVAFLALFVAWTFFYGIPWFSTVAANALPAEVSIYIGQGTLETMDERIFTTSKLDTDRQQHLTKQFYQLLPDPENNGEIKYRLLFRGGGFIGANAFALPDGTVVLTDELVDLADNDEEILSVLLHEIGHVEHRHSLRQVISHSGLAAVTVLITGDVNSAGSMILALPNILMSSSYSRDLEWEADSFALEQMKKIGISPTRFADFMQKLENYGQGISDDHGQGVKSEKVSDDVLTEQSSDSEPEESSSRDKKNKSWLNYISSHPPSIERIKRFRQAETTEN